MDLGGSLTSTAESDDENGLQVPSGLGESVAGLTDRVSKIHDIVKGEAALSCSSTEDEEDGFDIGDACIESAIMGLESAVEGLPKVLQDELLGDEPLSPKISRKSKSPTTNSTSRAESTVAEVINDAKVFFGGPKGNKARPRLSLDLKKSGMGHDVVGGSQTARQVTHLAVLSLNTVTQTQIMLGERGICSLGQGEGGRRAAYF